MGNQEDNTLFAKGKYDNDHYFFHYTSMDVLCNILKNYRKDLSKADLIFWASSIFTMNDPLEMEHGRRVLEILLPALEDIFQIPPENRLNISLLESKGLIEDYTHTPFVLSLSKNCDDLPMWVMYGNKGRGVCLVFDKDINTSEVEGLSKPELLKVNYNNGVDNYPRLSQIYNKGIVEWSSSSDKDEIVKIKNKTLNELLFNLCPYIKSGSYANENEFRFSFFDVPKEQIFFRNRSDSIIPYVKVPIPIAYLKGIIVGPCCNLELTIRAIRLFLYCCNLEQVDVIASKVPYRDM